jgi:hypothetical protein
MKSASSSAFFDTLTEYLSNFFFSGPISTFWKLWKLRIKNDLY